MGQDREHLTCFSGQQCPCWLALAVLLALPAAAGSFLSICSLMVSFEATVGKYKRSISRKYFPPIVNFIKFSGYRFQWQYRRYDWKKWNVLNGLSFCLTGNCQSHKCLTLHYLFCFKQEINTIFCLFCYCYAFENLTFSELKFSLQQKLHQVTGFWFVSKMMLLHLLGSFLYRESAGLKFVTQGFYL